ncbi:MAG: hypothetical protein JNL80_09720, partial [Phycisphaerae bacterium]|nr:hypothetical protein [Phycisphaerae bacterium]
MSRQRWLAKASAAMSMVTCMACGTPPLAKPASDPATAPAPTTFTTRAEAEAARIAAWSAYVAKERDARAAEVAAGVVSAGGKTMKFFHVTRGAKPERGHSLFISMHGGGGAPARVNDSQWE